MKQQFCPNCGASLETYYIGPDCSIIGENYSSESGLKCTRCDYAIENFPLGCLWTPFIIIAILVLLKWIL